jgi:hypothetical protein
VLHDLIQIGEPVEHRGIVVAPLFPRRDPVAHYLTLDEALAQGLRIAEVDEAGTVPELVVENPLDSRVLLYDGEELIGAKQNRILNVSVLVEARSKLEIPVSCVEQGPLVAALGHVRAGSARRVAGAPAPEEHRALHDPLARGASQGEVWDAVQEKAARMGVHSPTGASSDTYRAYRRDLRALEGAFPALPGQCGAILGIGRDTCLDAVSRPDAFARLWPKLRAGYLLDALERLDGPATPCGELEALVSGVDRSEWSRQPSAGLGEDVRIRGAVVGSGLELDGELIQVSAFHSDERRGRVGRIARPSSRS